jgi:hypothetical protein
MDRRITNIAVFRLMGEYAGIDKNGWLKKAERKG